MRTLAIGSIAPIEYARIVTEPVSNVRAKNLSITPGLAPMVTANSMPIEWLQSYELVVSGFITLIIAKARNALTASVAVRAIINPCILMVKGRIITMANIYGSEVYIRTFLSFLKLVTPIKILTEALSNTYGTNRSAKVLLKIIAKTNKEIDAVMVPISKVLRLGEKISVVKPMLATKKRTMP